MAENHLQARRAGHVGNIKIPVTFSVILTLVVIGCGVLFIVFPKWHDPLIFFGAGFTAIATILSAYYVGKGLEVTIQQRAEGLHADAVAKSLRFAERWNDPSYSRTLRQWRALLKQVKMLSAHEIESLLESQDDKRAVVTDVLNFFEEMALCANEGIADDSTLRRLFRGRLTHYFGTMESWIKVHRVADGHPAAWIELENMLGRWNSTGH